jgi:predicted nucleic acid-binding protein
LLAAAEAGELIYVPAHWPTEVLHGLTRASRRGRLEDPSVDQFLTTLLAYRIVVDSLSVAEQWNNARQLIVRHRLSAYDAAYLALAKRLRVSLASFDAQLRLAAEAEGVLLTI